MGLTESKTVYQGICCDSCQEDVNVRGCEVCLKKFEDGENIYCRHHSQTDCEHFHKECKPEDGK